VLFECLTGRTPYPRPSEAAILYAHAHDPPPRITEARPDLPSTVDGVIAAGMAKTPAERPRTARELIAAAEAALESHPATSRPRGVHVRFQRRAASASGRVPVGAPAVRTTPPELARRGPTKGRGGRRAWPWQSERSR
jgi:hypothetical protein